MLKCFIIVICTLYTFHSLSAVTYCWLVRGRIKEKIGFVYSIKYQVYCMENTVQWSANTVQILVCYQCSKQTPLIIFAHLCGFLTPLKWIHKDCPVCITIGIIWNHCFCKLQLVPNHPVKTLLQDLARKGPFCTPARSCKILQDPTDLAGAQEKRTFSCKILQECFY